MGRKWCEYSNVSRKGATLLASSYIRRINNWIASEFRQKQALLHVSAVYKIKPPHRRRQANNLRREVSNRPTRIDRRNLTSWDHLPGIRGHIILETRLRTIFRERLFLDVLVFVAYSRFGVDKAGIARVGVDLTPQAINNIF